MVYVIIFIIISTITGFLITYFLDAKPATGNCQLPTANCQLSPANSKHLSILERLTYGVVIGLSLSTWFVYLFSLFFGIQFKCIYASLFILVTFCSIFLISRGNFLKAAILSEAEGIKNDFLCNRLSCFIHIIIFCFFAAIFWRLFYRTIIWHDGGIYTGLPNNYGDLPLHLSYITSFVWGNNIPPQDPSFAGKALAYPILSDFLSAIFLKFGIGFKEILFIPGFLLTLVFYGTLYYFVYGLTKKRMAALVSEFVFFFSGGLGFCYFFLDICNTQNGMWQFLAHLPRDYTKITSLNYHWITPLTCLNVTQRSLLFGFPLTIIVFSLLYKGIERRQLAVSSWQLAVGRRQNSVGSWQLAGDGREKTDGEGWKWFLFAGVIAGALPFFHTHSFMAILMVTIPLAIVFWDWRRWFLFFIPAFVLSLPQILSFSGHVGGGGFFKYNFGWMAGKENFLWFWLKNTGIFWFAYIGGLTSILIFKKRCGISPIIVYYSLPFLILFFLPNLTLLAPWKWDNIKILIYWFLGSISIVSIGLVYLYEIKRFKIPARVVFFIAVFSLIFAGGIDVFRYAVAPVYLLAEFSKEDVEISKQIIDKTAPDSIFLTAPIFNHVVFLTGRKTLMGYPGHVWSHGYKDYTNREQDISKMLQGKPEAIELIDKYKADYATVGPHERSMGVSKGFFDINYERLITSDNYYVYDLNKKLLLGKETIIGGGQGLIVQGRGLYVDYYPNIRWEGESIYDEIKMDVAFNWPMEDLKPIKSPFSSIWKGYIDIQETGKHTFKLTSDDGSWLYIDNVLVIDNGGYHASKSSYGSIDLEKGHHDIMIKYFDGGGGAVMQLLWIPPDGEESEIPAENLYYK